MKSNLEELKKASERGIAYLLWTIEENHEFKDEFLYADLRPGILDTPARFVRAMLEMTSGYSDSPEEILDRQFDGENCDEMVVVSKIDFTSLCEHHLLPFIGSATIAYIPNGFVVGLSKIPRLVDCYAKRLQMQERLTVEIADALEKQLKPKGVGVILTARHQCMSCRGVKKQNAEMHTSVLRGVIKSDDKARAEFLQFRNA